MQQIDPDFHPLCDSVSFFIGRAETIDIDRNQRTMNVDFCYYVVGGGGSGGVCACVCVCVLPFF